MIKNTFTYNFILLTLKKKNYKTYNITQNNIFKIFNLRNNIFKTLIMIRSVIPCNFFT